MKKGIIIAVLFCISTFSFAGTVTPTLGLRFNDIASADSTNAIPDPETSFGLKMEVGDGIYTGFDSVVGSSSIRIYVEQSYGKIGLGIAPDGSPTFTVGAIYNVYSNLNVEMEYLMNQLVDNENDKLRLSLTISF